MPLGSREPLGDNGPRRFAVSTLNPLEIVIIGAGGHGSEVWSYIQDLAGMYPDLHVVGFVDEHESPRPWLGTEILGNFEDLKETSRVPESCLYITAVGDNQVRRGFAEKADNLHKPKLEAWSLIHPLAAVGQEVEVGVGACFAPGSIVTTNVRMGKHCILNVNASVSHDCIVGDFVNINPGAVVAGRVRIGDGCYIGAGATILDKVTIGEWTIIGAGAVVIDDIPAHVTAVGVPARAIKRHEA